MVCTSACSHTLAAMTQAEFRLLSQPTEFAALATLFGAVWYGDGTVPYAGDLLHAVSFAGGYVAGAYVDAELIGGSLAILGRHENELVLHSHVTGVLPGMEHRGVGSALKLHQREWARSNNLPAITWTFDPLVRRNAWFNLAKLGARFVGYVESFYGEADDTINGGDETDRAIVRWSTTEAAPNEPTRGFVVVDADATATKPTDDERVINIATPPDIVALRTTDPASARRWRRAVRQAFVDAFARGFEVSGFDRDGHYTLERRGSQEQQ